MSCRGGNGGSAFQINGLGGVAYPLLSARCIAHFMRTADQQELELPVPQHHEVIHLPLGLLGFEKIKEYLWMATPEEAPFCWIQALRDSQLTFLVLPVSEARSDYAPEISDEDASFLGLTSPLDALIYGIVTLRPHGRATINLKGPIVLNRFTFRGKQVVLTNAAEYPLQYPLPVAE